MKLSKRIKALRKESCEAEVRLDHERAEIVTDFYMEHDGKYSIPVMRALVFKEICMKKSIYIGKNELIVGERGPRPKAVPCYPEVACNSLEDFRLLESQERIPYRAGKELLEVYQNKIIPYWRGRTMRDRLFSTLDDEWKETYNAGIFTEYYEQRAPGSCSLDDTFYRVGLREMQSKIEEKIDKLDFFSDMQAMNKWEELKAMHISCDAAIILAERHAVLAEEMAEKETDPECAGILRTIAANCRQVPAYAPRNLWQALQMYWFLHICVITEVNGWDACSPGRADRHFFPFYERDMEAGTIDKDFAYELLCAWWIKFNNQPAPAKYGVTAAESGSYNDFVNINLGGVDDNGMDSVNEMSYMFLDVLESIALIQPQANLQLSAKNPDDFLKAACRVIRHGYGYPSIFNAEMVIQEQLLCGKTLVDARNGGTNGCVETTCHGKESAVSTGYINGPKLLELTLNNGFDPRTKKWLGPQTGDASSFTDFESFFGAFKRQLEHVVALKLTRNQYIEQVCARTLPVPFLSVLINDCIEKGMDYNAGGARYNSTFLLGVGLGTMSDCLSAIKYNIYDKGIMTWDQLLAALRDNFDGHETVRQMLINKTPRYGNDNPYPDELMTRVSNMFIDAIDGFPNTKGGQYRIIMLPTTCHIYFGSVTGATPDGRFAGKPLSEGISAVQGASAKGPTAALKSAACLEHARVCGALLNMKFNPDVIKDDDGIDKMAQLIRAYFRMGGSHIQFNIVNREILIEAQKHPEEYRDLIVRVAGYSDYFSVLGKDLQDEIISRTEYAAI